METDGPKSQEGAPQSGTVSNVVPFPRDWLGPRDELIPFGRDPAEETKPESEAADVREISLAPPPGPDAFWGEDSAEIHAVLQGPSVRPREEAPEPGPAAADKRRPSRAFVAIAAGVLAAVVAAAVTIVGFSGKSSAPRVAAVPNPVMGSPSAEHMRLSSLQRSLAAAAASGSRKPRTVRRRSAARSSRHRPVERPARHVNPVHQSSPASPVTSHPVANSSSSVTTTQSPTVSSSPPPQPVDVPSSSSSGSVVSEPSHPTSSSTTSSGSATSSHSGGQSSKAKAPAGPTGSSALLGPGHCNC